MVSYSDELSSYKHNTWGRFLFKGGLLLLMFKSFMLSFTWYILPDIVYGICLLTSLIFLLTTSNIFSYKKNNIILSSLFVFILLYEFLVVKLFTITWPLTFVSASLCGCTIIWLKDEIKKDLLNCFTKSLAVILAFSISGWFLFLAGIPLPHYTTYDLGGFYTHTHFYLFLLNGEVENQIIYRFLSIFLEPGHLATTGCFLLFANKFNLKRWEIKLIFLAVLLSLSLAGYGLLIIGVFFSLILYHKHYFRYIILMLTLLGSLSIFFINLSDGENIVYEKIISRLEFENGEMKGNNRFSSTFESNYQEYLKTNKKYLGIGKEMASLDYDWSIGSAGWKKLILKKGLIGSILILSFYILLLIDKWSKAGFAFFIIFFIAYLVRDYPLREYWLYIYIVSLPVLQSYKSPLTTKSHPL